MMKKAFTLVEMLIVVAILAVLMSIVFRLGSVGGEDTKRSDTIVRLQKIENCLSGYYAAFGSYPPVKLHGSRDIYTKVDANGDQVSGNASASSELNDDSGNTGLVWAQVSAACRAQPFGCEYPGDEYDKDVIEAWSDELKNRVNNSEDYPNYASSGYAKIFQQGFSTADANTGFSSDWDNDDWKVVKVFKFGLMSFLLPRYLFMMGGDSQFYGIGANPFAQWENSNDLPCDPYKGQQYNNWKEIVNANDTTTSANASDLAKIANIPSQAVCARWIPNLEGICSALRSMSFFGVKITDDDRSGLGLDDEYPPDPGTHFPPSGTTPYKNATVTITDGWSREFYYYSPAPYQSYTVWSAGSNGKTFPPWVSLESLDNATERKTAQSWKADDVIQMSN